MSSTLQSKDFILNSRFSIFFDEGFMNAESFFKKVSSASYHFQLMGISETSVCLLEMASEIDILISLLALINLKAKVALINPKINISLRSTLIEKLGEFHHIKTCVWDDSHHLKLAFDETASCILIATSGSSKDPKWILSSLKKWHYSIQASCHHLQAKSYQPWLLNLPLFHVSGLAIFFRALFSHAPLVITKKPDDYQGLRVSMVPRQLEMMIHEGSLDKLLKACSILIGGGKLSEDIFAQVKHLPIYLTYGMTETLSQITCSIKSPTTLHEGHVLQDKQIHLDTNGHILVQGLSVCDFTYDRGQLTYIRNKEGLLETKDHGYLDPKGHLHILGRADERLEMHGEKIYPLHIESCLKKHFNFKSLTITHIKQNTSMIIIAFCDPVPEEQDLAWLKKKVGALFFPSYFLPMPQGNSSQKILLSYLKQVAESKINLKS